MKMTLILKIMNNKKLKLKNKLVNKLLKSKIMKFSIYDFTKGIINCDVNNNIINIELIIVECISSFNYQFNKTNYQIVINDVKQNDFTEIFEKMNWLSGYYRNDFINFLSNIKEDKEIYDQVIHYQGFVNLLSYPNRIYQLDNYKTIYQYNLYTREKYRRIRNHWTNYLDNETITCEQYEQMCKTYNYNITEHLSFLFLKHLVVNMKSIILPYLLIEPVKYEVFLL